MHVNRKKTTSLLPVIMMDLKGFTIKKFKTILEAEKSTRVSRGRIADTCRGIHKTSGKHKWKLG